MRSWFLSFAVTAAIAATIATVAFISYRNRSFETTLKHRAHLAARQLAAGEVPTPPVVLAAMVDRSRQRGRYPFLRERRLVEGRVLGGPQAGAFDKLLYDAAARAERNGAFVERLPNGLAVAALPNEQGVAVAAAASSHRQTFPWLIFVGLLSVGAVVAAARCQRRRRCAMLRLGARWQRVGGADVSVGGDLAWGRTDRHCGRHRRFLTAAAGWRGLAPSCATTESPTASWHRRRWRCWCSSPVRSSWDFYWASTTIITAPGLFVGLDNFAAILAG